MGCSFSSTAPEWVPSMGCSHLGTGLSVWVPLAVTHPATKPAPAWTPCCTSPQVLPSSWSSTGFPLGHSCLQAFTFTSIRLCLNWLQGDLCFPVDLHGPYHGLHHGLQATSVSAPGAPPPNTSPPTLTSAWLILSHVLTPFWLFFLQEVGGFFSLSWLHYPGGATAIADGSVLSQRWVPSGASWDQLSWTWEKLLPASHWRPTCSPHAPKLCHANGIKLYYQKAENLIGK